MGFSVRPVVCGAKQTQKIPVTGIVLNYSTLYLQPDATQQLTATVEPEDASNKAVTWTSSDASVATVSTDGLVTAKAEGSCTITCSAKDGSGVKAECKVKVNQTGGFEVHVCPDDNHPHMIDLGLPSGTKWACCNVGAGRPEAFGDFFAWGETEPKDNYSNSTYRYCDKTYGSATKYTGDGTGYNGFKDGLSVLLPEDDAATVNWGSNWQTPSADQLEELVNSDYTTLEYMWDDERQQDAEPEWGEVYTHYLHGIKITSKTNGKSVFMPAAGIMDGTDHRSPAYWSGGDPDRWYKTYAHYMSNELSWQWNMRSYLLYFFTPGDGGGVTFGAERWYGFTVRPVVKQ